MNHSVIDKFIGRASDHIGNTWPLYSFVTSNPLSGYEDSPFPLAVERAKKVLGASVYPKASIYRKAFENGEIELSELKELFQQNGYGNSPEYYLQLMESQEELVTKNPQHVLDRVMVKWLSAFLDEGLAEWEMPFKSLGFYKAWRKLAPYDDDFKGIKVSDIPKNSKDAMASLLSGLSDEQIQDIFTYHLAALPGWTGYIKHRKTNQPLWQDKYPMDLEEYLAVRLWTAKHLGIAFLVEPSVVETSRKIKELQYIWLKAWEKSWQLELVRMLKDTPDKSGSNKSEYEIPDAQMVFCIDTRSELIRRHVESKGSYETFGYAGFFGIAMDYDNERDGIVQKSCPPIVDSCYTVSEEAVEGGQLSKQNKDRKNELVKFWDYFLKRMKNMLPSTFGFVEGSGFFYGFNLVARTIAPVAAWRFANREKVTYETICEPELKTVGSTVAVPIAEQAAIIKSGFDLMGWKNFAPLVIFVGHGSHSANNPFASSLDCGACAASPGRHNARMLAKMANNDQVRAFLSSEFGIDIPSSTLFIGAEHNTTTDEIQLFDSNLSDHHKKLVSNIKSNLKKAQLSATRERLGIAGNSVAQAKINASNWGETRPEWGLAKNASFVIAPRKATMHHNLNGRCFLHSYDWKIDKEGKALEAIMQGPMVVTQWINNHYYFATVDNEKFGSGTKTIHNITGQFGAVQGNGGDLKMGLPWESLYSSENKPYHTPIRLSVIVQAPKERVNTILSRNEKLRSLVENEWIHLIIMDPKDNTEVYWKENQFLYANRDNGMNSMGKKGQKQKLVESTII